MMTLPSIVGRAAAQDRGGPAEAGGGGRRMPPTAMATRATTSPKIDGRIDEDVWQSAPIIDAFTQQDPREGAPASQRTTVRVMYDDQAIYIAARMDDTAPVTSRLGRRDMALASSDWFRVSIDGFRDRRSAFRFDVNPNGVRRDATLSAGGGGGVAPAGGGGGGGGGGGATAFGGPEGDLAWDAVWEASSQIDEHGWTTELRIPFSQLRFTMGEEPIWGLQLERLIASRQEYQMFSFVSKSEPGGVVAFGDLVGLRGLRPGRPLELTPYLLGNLDRLNAAGNPFRRNNDLGGNAGLDARYRLSSNLILSATANPDFGQVEVDPAIINLTAFEVRLEEKRPFFVEGANTFRFGVQTQGPATNAAQLLYSRRVGRPPQVGVSSGIADVPGTTGILGAAKVSGRTAAGWSIGVLDAVTGTERGRVLDSTGTAQPITAEPRTNYLATRMNKEFRRGLTTLGGMFTSVNRQNSDSRTANALRDSAYAGGIDFGHEWARRSWTVAAFMVGSRVTAGTASMLATQRSSSRYYQRPDARRFRVDPAATSLGGYATTVQVRKVSGVHWSGDGWVGVISPGFEINDAGFLQRGDRMATGGAIRYSERTPKLFYRTWSVNLVQNHTTNYDGDWIEKILRPSAQITWKNYWTTNFTGNIDRVHMDDRLTRGGPLALKPRSWSTTYSVGSDPRRSIAVTADAQLGGDSAGSRVRGGGVLMDVRTSTRWNLSFGPRWTRTIQAAQFVSTQTDAWATSTFGARYIFARLDQTEVSLVTRLNYTFTPNLTLELYLQPLVSNGLYGSPKQLLAPRTFDFGEYGRDLGTIARSGTSYIVDPDGVGQAAPFSVPDRTFTTRSVRGNAVLRWEYRLGSTFYLVWQQERLDSAVMPDFTVRRALGRLTDGQGHSVIVMKWSYRFN